MTNQVRERLTINNGDVALDTFPDLPPSEYLENREDWPPQNVDFDHPDILTTGTWCWRGYNGHWEVVGSKLFLKSIRGKFRLKQGKPLFASWVTKSLVFEMPRGTHQFMELVVEQGYVKGLQPHEPRMVSRKPDGLFTRMRNRLFGEKEHNSLR